MEANATVSDLICCVRRVGPVGKTGVYGRKRWGRWRLRRGSRAPPVVSEGDDGIFGGGRPVGGFGGGRARQPYAGACGGQKRRKRH
ncbi:hypothetical protein GUJ93_ZPchr0007g5546 [Zizania palustris]|uniref:Uncharacterized protein n=1 Tax=Zizania palustris TaxID=103762 RepID=A0A8J5VUE1_ZIZPA|nr:hypothetical protein GUJ93_ZPchr0007g5546 [Zizania palustris]